MSYSKKNSARSKKLSKRIVERGILHVYSSFNNTIVTISDTLGNVLVIKTGGSDGRYKGSRKSALYPAQIAARSAASIAKDTFGMKEVALYVKGVGKGREAVTYALGELGLRVLFIKDVTPKAFNGTRPPKKRRV